MLALIAGAGALPHAVANAQTTPPFVATLEGFAPDALEPDVTFRLETFGTLLATLRKNGVKTVCLCGHIRRPDMNLALIDDATMPMIPAFRAALGQGDDGALRVVMGLIEDAGFSVIGAHEAAPSLLMPKGQPTLISADQKTETDVSEAAKELIHMGKADLGQACVVVEGKVVLTEDDAGTDAMLRRYAKRTKGADAGDLFSQAMDVAGDMLGAAADWLSGTDGQRKGILAKGPKPNQDRRADLPTIGPDTVALAARAGLAGIVIAEGGVIVIDQPKVIAMLDRAGMFLWVRDL